MKRALTLFLALCLVLLPAAPALAETAIGTTLRLADYSGTVDVKNAAGSALTVAKDMRLYNGYCLATSAKSDAFISLDSDKAVRLDERSKASVQKSGSQLEVCLVTGQLFFNVTKPLASSETMNIRTSTMITGVRGSFGWVNAEETGLMHGHVELRCTNPRTGEVRRTELRSGQRVYFSGSASGGLDAGLAGSGFTKTEIRNPDVPSIVVEAMRSDPTLIEQVRADVPGVDVDALVSAAAPVPVQAGPGSAEEAPLTRPVYYFGNVAPQPEPGYERGWDGVWSGAGVPPFGANPGWSAAGGEGYPSQGGMPASFIPSGVVASGSAGPNVTWTLYDSGWLLLSGSGEMYDYRIRDEVFPDTPWFPYQESISHIEIAQSISAIGDYAFAGCAHVASIAVPASVSRIGNCAFWSCTGLSSVTLPGTLSALGTGVFWGCSALTSVSLPAGLISVPADAFSGCSSLRSVTIPARISSIGDSAFWNCNALQDVYYGGSESRWREMRISGHNTPLSQAVVHCSG